MVGQTYAAVLAGQRILDEEIDMILYKGDIRAFIDAANKNTLAGYMASVFERKYSRRISIEQQREWNYSLRCMCGVLMSAEIPDSCCIRLDFVLSQYCSRLEALLAGTDPENRQNIVMIELLPWRESRVSNQEDMIEVNDDSGWHYVVHPAYQSAAYGRYISERSSEGEQYSVRFIQTVYLYDYIRNHPEPLLDSKYNNLLSDVHLFFSDEVDNLSSLLNKYMSQGGGRKILDLLHLRDQFCPEGLDEYLNKLDEGTPLISLYEDQKMAAASVLRDLDEKGTKSITLISGTPGTGKTAIAVTLIHSLARKGKRIAYICYTAAQMYQMRSRFQEYEDLDILTLHRLLEMPGQNPVDPGKSNSFAAGYDMIIYDEAQNLEGYPAGRQVLDGLISSVPILVFLYSSSQRVLGFNFNLARLLEEQALKKEMTYHAFDLSRNIRFKERGGGPYWLLHQLQLDSNSNYDDWAPDSYEINVVDHPDILADYIREKKSRGSHSIIVASFRKGILKEEENGAKCYVLEEYGFSRQVATPGNITFEGWLNSEAGDELIGTVHMCQGLEVDYAGILIDDLTYDQETGRIPLSNGSGAENELDERILKGIYHVLFTRARKGVCIFCRDQRLNSYLMDKLSYARRKHYWINYFLNLYSAEAEERRVQELCDSNGKAASEEEHARLTAQLEKAREEAEYYRKRYMEARAVLESLGITPEDMENIQNKLNEIKSGAEQIENEEERACYIQDKTSVLLLELFMPMTATPGHVAGIEKRLEQAVGDSAWKKISPVSKRFLITAEVVFESIEAYNQLIDFSGVCLQVTKAFECEMTYRYFTRYREYLKNRFGNNYFNNMPQTFYKMKRGNKVELDEDDYTLGSIIYTAGMWSDGNIIKGYWTDHQMFMDYARAELLVYPNNAKAIIKRHLGEIEMIRQKYRNSAAHKDSVDVITARECLDYIVEIHRILGSLLDDYRF